MSQGGCQHKNSAKQAMPFAPRNMIVLQGSVLVVVAFIATFFGAPEAMSIVWGGMAALVPNALFACIFFARYRARSGLKIMVLFYVGELGKLLLTAILAVVFFNVFVLNILAFIVGVACVSLSLLLAPILPSRWMRRAS